MGGIIWEGKGLDEIGKRKDNLDVVIRVDKRYFRPSEVESLLGDASKAQKKLGWENSTSLEELISQMIENDKIIASKKSLLLKVVLKLLIKKNNFKNSMSNL